MSDINAFGKSQKSQVNFNSNANPKRKRERERTKPGALTPNVQVERTFDSQAVALEASGSNLQGRVDAGDIPSASTSTTTTISRGKRKAKATRRIGITGTATDGEPHIQTTGTGKGKGKLKEEQPVRVEAKTESSIDGNLDYAMAMAANMEVDHDHDLAPLQDRERKSSKSARNPYLELLPRSANPERGDGLDVAERGRGGAGVAEGGAGRGRGGAGEAREAREARQREEPTPKRPKAKKPRATANTIAALKELVVSMNSANVSATTARPEAGGGPSGMPSRQRQTGDPSTLALAPGSTPPSAPAPTSALIEPVEPTRVSKASVSSQTPAPASTPAQSHPSLNPTSNPPPNLNPTSNRDFDYSLNRFFFPSPSTGTHRRTLPSVQSPNPTPTPSQPQNQSQSRLQAEVHQLVHQHDLPSAFFPSASFPFTSFPSASFPSPSFPSTSFPSTPYRSGSQDVSANQPTPQFGSHSGVRQNGHDQPPDVTPYYIPVPPYTIGHSTTARPSQGEREKDQGMVKLSLFARTGFHDGGKQGGAQGVRQGGRQGELPLSERTRIIGDASPASRRVLEMREDVRRRVQSVVQRAFGSEYRVELFGSTRYGASFSDSDLDMVILDPHYPQGYTDTKLEDPIYNSRKLANCIRKARFAAVEARPRSTVPIVKFKDPITSLECDLNVNSTLGMINSDMIKAYISLYPPLKSLIFEIKEWAKPLGLNSPTGTKEVPVSWSSYSLVGMAVAWCMHQGLLPSLQAGLPPLGASSASLARPPSRTGSGSVQAQGDSVMAESEADLHLHLAGPELVPEASVVGASLSSEMTPGQDQLVWTLKPHRGWDARHWPADAETVQAEMRAIAQSMGPERRSAKQLFAEWLLFWSKFDFEHQAVCIRLPGGIVDRESPEVWEATHRKHQLPAAICVVDPFIRSKNCTVSIARKTLEIFKEACAKGAIVQAAMAAAEDVRTSRIRTGTGKSSTWGRERDGGGRGRGRIKF